MIYIPVKILKQNADIFSDYIRHFFNYFVNEGKILNLLKEASIKPVFKKSYRVSEESSCLMRILPAIAKIFKTLLSKQVTSFMAEFLS